MKRKRVIALLTALTMLAGLITGCGASGETQETAEPAAAEEAGEETPAEESGETASAEGAEAVTIWYYWETEGHQVALIIMSGRHAERIKQEGPVAQGGVRSGQQRRKHHPLWRALRISHV